MKATADPNLIVYFDGKYMPLRDAHVNILTHALHYGTGVFEGIRAHWVPTDDDLFILRAHEHYERWKKNCGILRIHVPATVPEAVRHHRRADASQCIPYQHLRPAPRFQVRRAHRRQY